MVHLILPPIWGFRHPSLSLARLKGHLQDHGIRATCHDWNLEYHYDKIAGLSKDKAKLGIESLRRVMKAESSMEAERKRAVKLWAMKNLRAVMAEIPRYAPFETNTLINECLASGPDGPDEETLTKDARLPEFLDEQIEREVEQGRFRDGDFFGISMVAYFQVPAGLLLIRRLRKRFPASVIVAGGTAFNHIRATDLEELAGLAALDRIVQGPGETILQSICESARAGEQRSEAPLSPSIGGLLFDDFDLDRYMDPVRCLPYQIYRHCFWRKCHYCNFRDPWAEKDRVDIDCAVDDFANLTTAYRARSMSLLDNAIPGAKLERLARGLVDRGLEIVWDATVRPDHQMLAVDWQLIRDSGCTSVDVGLESGSERILALMNRGTSRGDVEELFERIAAAGIRANVNVMLGFPGETRADADQTVEMLEAISANAHHVAPAGFQLAKGSAIYDDPSTYGLTLLSEEKFCFTGIVEFVYEEDHDAKRAFTAEMEKRVIDRFLYQRGFKLPRRKT